MFDEFCAWEEGEIPLNFNDMSPEGYSFIRLYRKIDYHVDKPCQDINTEIENIINEFLTIFKGLPDYYITGYAKYFFYEFKKSELNLEEFFKKVFLEDRLAPCYKEFWQPDKKNQDPTHLKVSPKMVRDSITSAALMLESKGVHILWDQLYVQIDLQKWGYEDLEDIYGIGITVSSIDEVLRFLDTYMDWKDFEIRISLTGKSKNDYYMDDFNKEKNVKTDYKDTYARIEINSSNKTTIYIETVEKERK